MNKVFKTFKDLGLFWFNRVVQNKPAGKQVECDMNKKELERSMRENRCIMLTKITKSLYGVLKALTDGNLHVQMFKIMFNTKR